MIKKIILCLCLCSLLLPNCFAMMVVKSKITGDVVYRQVPDFEKGKGIANAVILNPKIKAEDLEEVNMTEQEVSDALPKPTVDTTKDDTRAKLKALGFTDKEADLIL